VLWITYSLRGNRAQHWSELFAFDVPNTQIRHAFEVEGSVDRSHLGYGPVSFGG
jgi:hypothetical protein